MLTLRFSTFNLCHYQKTRKLLQFGTEFFTLSLINNSLFTTETNKLIYSTKKIILKLISKSIIIINNTTCINYLENNIMIGLDTTL